MIVHRLSFCFSWVGLVSKVTKLNEPVANSKEHFFTTAKDQDIIFIFVFQLGRSSE